MTTLNKELTQKLRKIFSDFRDAEKLVVSEISTTNYSHDDVVNMDNSFTNFYRAVEDIRSSIGIIIDDIDKGHFDNE